MLSSLPKIADRAFILGHLFPTILFALGTIALLADLPWPAAFLASLAQGENWQKLAFFVLVVWALAVALQMLNVFIFRVLEGYIGPAAALSFFAKRQSTRFETLRAEVDDLRERYLESEMDQLTRKTIELRRDFPEKAADLLPTSFGNAVKAFETYPDDVYGADAVTLWPHMAAVIPKDYQANISDARAQVDALANVTFLSAALAVAAAIRSVVEFLHVFDGSRAREAIGTHWPLAFLFAAACLLLAGLCRLAYILSIRKIHAWGDWVMASFDCYLADLAARLGYQLPKTGRREFWGAIAQRAAYHLAIDDPAERLPVKDNELKEKEKDAGDGKGDGKDGKEGKEGKEGEDSSVEAEQEGDDAGQDDPGDGSSKAEDEVKS